MVWEWRSSEGEKWEVTTKKKRERERAQFLILDNVHISEVAKESEPLKHSDQWEKPRNDSVF